MMSGNGYTSSVEPGNAERLLQLQMRMADYYKGGRYHTDFIKGINANWRPETHAVQIQMCERIPPHASILEVGCGDGSCAAEILQRTKSARYLGMDLNPELWKDKPQFAFVAGSATSLPFGENSFDVVLSMYVIEHLVFPVNFLDAAWKILRPGGRFLLIAPDFARNGMPSERVGLSYGSGREKLKSGKWLDALLTAYDTKVRIGFSRWVRRRAIERGDCAFPILTDPRCFKLPGFTPDCDAIYPVCPEEVIGHLKRKSGFYGSEIFYRDGGTAGLMVRKA
jgi:SAM-dependent methyltransferase